MPRYFGSILLLLVLLGLAGCGGNDEPPPTPTPLATFTPTVPPTAAPSATATKVATPVPAVTDTPIATATDKGTKPTATAVETTAAEAAVANTGDTFASPLVTPEPLLSAPESPLSPPAQVEAATPVPLKPVVGSWQLQTIKPSSSMAATDAPAGYRVAFGPTGVVRVMGDCKPGRGQYASTPDGGMSIAITYSDVRCAPESLADPFARALNEVSSYRYDGDRLILAYGEQGGEMGLIRTAQMASFGAPYLSWSNLQNSTFFVPDVPAGNNQAPLVDGEFRARLAPAAEQAAEATPPPGTGEFIVSLATMHTYGVLATPSPEEIAADPTLTSEISADTVVVLVVEDGAEGSAPKSYLVPVLNGGGMALPLTLEPLGEDVFVGDLRWNGITLTVDYDQSGTAMRRTYNFDADHFVPAGEEELPPRSPKARQDLPAQAVTLAPAPENSAPAGTSQAVLTGIIGAGEVHPYRLSLAAGQQLSVTLQSPYDDVWLSIFGTGDQTVLRSIRSDTFTWAGNVPGTQEYLVSAVAPGSGSPYTLTIQVAGDATAAGPATAEPASNAEEKTIHVVIDGSANVTPAVLDVLQRNGAGADFFIPAAELAQAAGTLSSASSAGHGLGMIAGSLTAPTSGGRDALFADVSAARQAVGDSTVRCLRLPPTADGYTRAAAAELGYDVVQWDVDAGTLSSQDILSQLFPGAVIHFGESGAESVAAALDVLLPAVVQQGYTVQPLCR